METKQYQSELNRINRHLKELRFIVSANTGIIQSQAQVKRMELYQVKQTLKASQKETRQNGK